MRRARREDGGSAEPRAAATDATRTSEVESSGFLHDLRSKPVEIVAGLFLAVLGTLLTLGGQERVIVAAGSVATLLAGILLAYVASESQAKRAALKEIAPTVRTTSEQLFHLISNMRNDLRDFLADDVDAETLVRVSNFVLQQMTVCTNQLQSGVLGITYDPTQSLQAHQMIAQLARELVSSVADADDDDDDDQGSRQASVDNEFRRLAEKIEMISSQQAGPAMAVGVRQVGVHCPRCRADVVGDLEAIPGNSTAMECKRCSLLFRAYIDELGRVATGRPTPPRATSKVEPLEFDCAHCGTTMKVVLASGSTQRRLCRTCLSIVAFTRGEENGEIVAPELEPISDGEVVGRMGSRPLLKAPCCGQLTKCESSEDGALLYAPCFDCLQVYGPFSRLTKQEQAQYDNYTAQGRDFRITTRASDDPEAQAAAFAVES